MRKLHVILGVIVGLCSMGEINAHGVQHHIWVGGVGVEAHHEVLIEGDSEIPLADASVQIYRPNQMGHPFQTGNTDVHGIFMFRPDTVGIWTVKFLDETGHGKVIEVPVNELNSVELEPDHAPGSWRDVLSGLGFIVLVFSLWIFLKKKK